VVSSNYVGRQLNAVTAQIDFGLAAVMRHVNVHGKQEFPPGQAIENLKQLCDTDFPGDYRIEIVDLCKNPGAAQKLDLVALSAIVRTLPTPIRKFVGTFADENGSLVCVDLTAKT